MKSCEGAENTMDATTEVMGRTVQAMSHRVGKYLTFRLADEEYGIEILKVQEIIGMMAVTQVPRTPSYVRGVINLRGKVIPIVDLRLKFSMESKEDTEKTCIIVVQVRGESGKVTMGFIVDEVCEVLDIGAEDIEESPRFGTGIDTTYILGLAKIKNNVKILVDINKVLAADEVDRLDQQGNSPDHTDECDNDERRRTVS